VDGALTCAPTRTRTGTSPKPGGVIASSEDAPLAAIGRTSTPPKSMTATSAPVTDARPAPLMFTSVKPAVETGGTTAPSGGAAVGPEGTATMDDMLGRGHQSCGASAADQPETRPPTLTRAK
jgi:hypothetical protein